jgi:hypothetical protein
MKDVPTINCTLLGRDVSHPVNLPIWYQVFDQQPLCLTMPSERRNGINEVLALSSNGKAVGENAC